MALTRAKKIEKVSALTTELQGATSAIVGTFTAMTASKDFELRKVIREAGGSYHVVKNKLAPIAAKDSEIAGALGGLKGVSSVAYTSGDPVALAKALSTWVKDNAEFTFKLGIVDGKVIDVAEINNLATLPGKEELFSKLLFLINSPATRIATVINATGRNLAVVVDQAVQAEKFVAGAAPAVTEAAPAAASAPVPEIAAATEAAPAIAEAAPAAVAIESTPAAAGAAPAAEDTEGASPQAEAAATEAPAEGA